jgi:arsenical pump membrane protein
VREALSLAALLALLITAVRRPRGLPEVVVAVPLVGLLLAVGAVSWHAASNEVERLGPVVGFLAAVLVIAAGCADEGVFRAAGGVMARAATRSAGRLLVAVAALAAVTTALLSLDTTVVLLTPVVVATVGLAGVPPRAPLYLTAHLANSGSLLLPVSNLTNLLAFALLPVSFGRFAALMALPWLVAVVVEVLVVRAMFSGDLAEPPPAAVAEAVVFPMFATVVVGLTVVGFGVGELIGIAPVWVATIGAGVLSAPRLVAGRTTPLEVFRATSPSFCLFVLGLGIVVRAAAAHGLTHLARDVLPTGADFPALLGVAAVAAVAANLINNLPATLLLLPVAGAGGVGPALAVLIGVNIGPNLTYPGSLATLLWRRAVAAVDGVPDLSEFTRLGIAAVPITILASTAALWLSLRVIGV